MPVSFWRAASGPGHSATWWMVLVSRTLTMASPIRNIPCEEGLVKSDTGSAWRSVMFRKASGPETTVQDEMSHSQLLVEVPFFCHFERTAVISAAHRSAVEKSRHRVTLVSDVLASSDYANGVARTLWHTQCEAGASICVRRVWRDFSTSSK
jgi:hypothetical protein